MTKVLIIEDDDSLQEAYSFILSAKDHHVDSAFNGKEGLEFIQKNDYDTVLLDIHMPIMDGWQFLEEYNKKKSSNTKVIMFSNMIDPEVEKKALEQGVSQCILKSSMTPSTILSVIES